MKLVLCLGNAGGNFKDTYHNIGFEMGDMFAKKLNRTFNKKTRSCVYFEDKDFIVAKPTTFMNLSGKAALDLIKKFKISPCDILVVFDDFDLPSGTYKLKLSGSGGTHNGARNIVETIGEDFKRLKIGIKPPEMFCDLHTMVLSKIIPHEKVKIDAAMVQALGEIENFVAKK